MFDHLTPHDVAGLILVVVNLLWSGLNLRLQNTLLDRVKKECPTRIEWAAANELRDEKMAEFNRRMARARL